MAPVAANTTAEKEPPFLHGQTDLTSIETALGSGELRRCFPCNVETH